MMTAPTPKHIAATRATITETAITEAAALLRAAGWSVEAPTAVDEIDRLRAALDDQGLQFAAAAMANDRLRAAIQRHHALRYGSGNGARPVFAPPDVALYRAAGIVWNQPQPWHPTPEQREEFRRDPDAAKRERGIVAGGNQ